MQKRLVLVCENSICPRKQPDVSGPGLGEAGRYRRERGWRRGDLGSAQVALEKSHAGVPCSSIFNGKKN